MLGAAFATVSTECHVRNAPETTALRKPALPKKQSGEEHHRPLVARSLAEPLAPRVLHTVPLNNHCCIYGHVADRLSFVICGLKLPAYFDCRICSSTMIVRDKPKGKNVHLCVYTSIVYIPHLHVSQGLVSCHQRVSYYRM